MELPGTSIQEVPYLLRHGRVLRQQLLPSFNCTYLVELGGEDAETCMAIYKPRDGETPLWDFPNHTLYKRERLAFLVSEALGWALVPTTIVRDGPQGIGVMQRFIHARDGMHYFTLMPAHKEEMLRIAVFDCIVNNCDRKGGHCLIDERDRVWAIDHGLTFAIGRKLRTVMWDLAGEPLTDVLKKDVGLLGENSRLEEEIKANLSPPEADAFYQRLEVVLGSPVVPIERLSDPYRPLPWPTI